MNSYNSSNVTNQNILDELLEIFKDILKSKQLTKQIYFIIWILSIIGVAFYYSIYLNELFIDSSIEGEEYYFLYITVLLFGFATLAQQVLIYADIYAAENKIEKTHRDYSGWVNNKKSELIFRYLLFLSILHCAGKITSSFSLWLPTETDNDIIICLSDFMKYDGSDNYRTMFTIGILLVYFSQLSWNIGALYFSKDAINNRTDIKPWTIKFRICCFAFTAFIAFIFWIIFLFSKKIADWATLVGILFGIYIILTIPALLFRSEKFCKRFN